MPFVAADVASGGVNETSATRSGGGAYGDGCGVRDRETNTGGGADMDDRKGILVVFPREMKRRIVRIAQANASNVNDTVVSMLAVEFGVEFEPTNVRSEAGLEAVRVLLRVPPQLKRAIQLYALDMSSNMTAIIVTTISKRIGMTVKMTPPRRTTPFGGGSGRPGRRPRRRAGTS